ncbi:hypothetical protein AX768_02135 [Burkholderia sp. PAMC 28687]|uniref:hypothetical protein n=1 Tax=Burkholderia sp. PAMC 28687 TaxID=1795874 RepID=UPI0007816C4F|nr:hypothetical protein [Burkholderia sp. PAMC 28687]AMM13089.1 hypothetical protein AX768_02135 [Burkholderia sp. PAMC 28687]
MDYLERSYHQPFGPDKEAYWTDRLSGEIAPGLGSSAAPSQASNRAQENHSGNFVRDNRGTSIAIAAIAIGPLIYWGVNEVMKKILPRPERPEK